MNNNILTLQTENHKLKDQINKFKQVCGLVSYIEDSTLKGGYRIVSSIQERDAIDMCHRKIGMIVSVRITETEYKNYRLISKNTWVEVASNDFIQTITMDVNDDMHLILQISSNPTIEMIIDTDGHLKLI